MVTARIKKYFIGILFLTANILFPQEISFEKIFPTNGVSYGWDVIEKKDGGYLVVGSITPFSTSVLAMSVDINGNLIWEKHLCPGLVRSVTHSDTNNYIMAGITSNNEDIIIIKINSDGDTLWTKVINKPKEEYATKIINTSDGGYAIIGWLRNKNLDIYLIKTDEKCDTLWTKSFGDYDTDLGYDIRELHDRGFIIAGTTEGGSEHNHHSSAYVIRTDSIGNLLWSKRYGINGLADCQGIVASSDGGFVLVGSTLNKDTNSSELYLLKINSNGDSLWVKTNNNNIPKWITSIQPTNDEGYILTGGSGILKTDKDGNTIWSKTIKGDGLSVKQTLDEGYIVSGIGGSDYDIILVKIRKDSIVNVEEKTSIAYQYSLFQNYPNPFNPITRIKFIISKDGNASIKIYDLLGKEVSTLIDQYFFTGEYEIEFFGANLPSGVYFYQLISGDFISTKKLLLMK